MTEETGEKSSRVAMVWPADLKKEAMGASKNLTEFTLEAVRTKLAGADREAELKARIAELEAEQSETRYLAQLLADRYAMGGDYDDRVSALMEVDLPTWLETDGWPAELAKLVPTEEPVVEVVNSKTYTDEELAKPSYQVAAEAVVRVPKDDLRAVEFEAEFIETEDPAAAMDALAPVTPPSDLMAKIAAKAQEKGVELTTDLDTLKPASQIPQPEPKPEPVHNHSFTLKTKAGANLCECGTWLDESTRPPTLRQLDEADENTELEAALSEKLGVPVVVDGALPPNVAVLVPTEPAPALQAPDDAPTSDTCPTCGDLLVDGECWTCNL